MLVFLYLLILDFASHWYHMYSSRGHHKAISAERNFLLRFYYGVYPFFGFCCVGTELFYILLYVLKFAPTLLIPGIDVPVASVRVGFSPAVLEYLAQTAHRAVSNSSATTCAYQRACARTSSTWRSFAARPTRWRRRTRSTPTRPSKSNGHQLDAPVSDA